MVGVRALPGKQRVEHPADVDGLAAKVEFRAHMREGESRFALRACVKYNRHVVRNPQAGIGDGRERRGREVF